jgi:hypothetical protein
MASNLPPAIYKNHAASSTVCPDAFDGSIFNLPGFSQHRVILDPGWSPIARTPSLAFNHARFRIRCFAARQCAPELRSHTIATSFSDPRSAFRSAGQECEADNQLHYWDGRKSREPADSRRCRNFRSERLVRCTYLALSAGVMQWGPHGGRSYS